ncbi:thyrotropin-releasing hormone receptor-like [Glandiceps talaboti]
MNDTGGNPVLDNNACVISARARNVAPIYAVYGTDVELYSSHDILLTRIIPGTFTCPFGIILNCLFLFVVFRVRSMRTLTNMYLSNQAVVDCTLLTAYYIVAVVEPITSDIVHDKSAFGAPGCLLINIILDIGLFVSEFNITLVTFERYMAICKPFKADRISSKSRTVKSIVLTWIIGLICSSPIVYFYTGWSTVCVLWVGSPNETAHLPTSYSTCWKGMTNAWQGALYTFSTLLAFICVLVTIIVLNTLTVRELRRGIKKYATHERDLKQRLYQQRQIVAMLAVTAGVFFVCLFPYHLELIFTFFNSFPDQGDIKLPSAWGELTRWLPMVNCSVNPIIYGILNKQYRRAFLKTLCCCCRGSRNKQEYSMSNLTVTSTVTKKEDSSFVETTYKMENNHSVL